MISTTERRSLVLTPHDRRWGAFDCEIGKEFLHGKKKYFQQLARYWQLHQAKCGVLNTLLGINTASFDALKHRPMTDYLHELMHWDEFNTKSVNRVLGASRFKQNLLITFMQGLVDFLLKTSKEEIQKRDEDKRYLLRRRVLMLYKMLLNAPC